MALKKCKECGNEVSSKAKTCPKCGAPVKKEIGCGTGLIIILAFLIIIPAIIGSLSSGPSSVTSQPNTSPAPKPQPTPKEIALSKTKLDFSWTKGGFDNVMEADFTITNNSQYAIKDIEITCVHYAKSGTRIDSNTRTIYDTVPANSKKSFNDFNMGLIHSQANSSSCTITDLRI